MFDYIPAQVVFEKIAEVNPEAYQRLVEAGPEVKDSEFNDEIIEDLTGIIKKAAGWGTFGSTVGLGMASHIGTGIASSLAGDLYDSLKRGITKTRNYRSMLSENPDLQKHPMGAKAVQGVFSTLHRFNPEFAGDPLVAGTFVRNHLESADPKRIDIGALTGLTGARKNLSDVKSKAMGAPSSAFSAGQSFFPPPQKNKGQGA